jgi:hypothetical protein
VRIHINSIGAESCSSVIAGEQGKKLRKKNSGQQQLHKKRILLLLTLK